MSSVEAVEREVRALENLGLEDLRSEWRRRWGAPPKMRSPELLRYQIAWRIQAAVFGGLDPQTRRKLRAKGEPRTEARLGPGVLLTREWAGRPIVVEVVQEGYRFDGRTFASLSKIAREVTGTNWNGPRFFGLRAEATP